MNEDLKETIAIWKIIAVFASLIMVFICAIVMWCVPQGGYSETIDINGIRFWRERYDIGKYRYYLISLEPVDLKEFRKRYFSDMLKQLNEKGSK